MGKDRAAWPKDGDVPETGPGLAAVAELVSGFGPATRRFSVALVALGEGPIDLDSLIRRSGLSRRSIEELLAAAAPDLDRRGHRYVLRSDRRAAYEERFDLRKVDRHQLSSVLDPLERPDGALAAVAELTRRRPRGRAHLDHVAATPETLLRRASWLSRTYDLGRTRLVFLGDHDLTSLATWLLHPGIDAQVVDLDEDLLAYLDTEARRLGADLRCSYADLRFGLPRDVVGWGDVIFTDPPYTPEGAALFARRGLEALRNRDFGQVLVAYGFGERQPTLGWKVQQALSNLGLVYEAVLPDFNTYIGGQAIGSTSDLYVCRPTPRSWKLPRQPDAAHIYTRGRQSSEALAPTPSPAVQQAAVELAGDGACVVVSDGWTGPGATRHVRLATLFESGVPSAWAKQVKAAVVDLADDPGPWLLRSLLAVNLDRLVLILPQDHQELSGQPRQFLAELVQDKYRLGEASAVDSTSPFLVVAAEAVAGDQGSSGNLRRYVLRRAQGNLLNVWREGLIEVAGQRDQRLTKNEARALVDSSGIQFASRVIDLPRHRIPALLGALGESVTVLEGQD